MVVALFVSVVAEALYFDVVVEGVVIFMDLLLFDFSFGSCSVEIV